MAELESFRNLVVLPAIWAHIGAQPCWSSGAIIETMYFLDPDVTLNKAAESLGGQKCGPELEQFVCLCLETRFLCEIALAVLELSL